MSNPNTLSATWGPRLLSLLRCIAAFLFIPHGTQKLFHYPDSFPVDPLPALLLTASVLEIAGGVFILVGLFTRPVAFLLAGEMAVAYFRTHAPQSFWPLLNGGEITVLFCFLYLYLAAAGGGAWSLDAVLRRRSPV
jgi:putative oxidoreductase